jgi:hypothetical protein
MGLSQFGLSGEEDHAPDSEAPPWPDAGEVWIIASQDGSEYGPSGGGFTVLRGNASGDLAVHYGLPGGTAAAGTDYTGPSSGGGTVTIPDGQFEAFIPVDPVDDASFEGTETVALTLAASGGYTVDPDYGTATITIQDNDRTGGPNTIGGVVWPDPDGNGIRTEFEVPSPDIPVSLWDQDYT